MAKRGKCGRKELRPKTTEPPKVHRFLPDVTRTFMKGADPVKSSWRVSGPRVSHPEREQAGDAALMRFFRQLQDAAKVQITWKSARLFTVDNPRKVCCPDGQTRNVVTLWHGSSLENGLSFLQSGFRTGWGGMFGPGIYLGGKDKAILFSGYHPGGPGGPVAGGGFFGKVSLSLPPSLPPSPGMLLKVRVDLGRVYQADKSMNQLRQAPEGYDSVMGVKGATEAYRWRKSSATYLNHDEWCVYDPCQVALLEIHLLG